MSTSILRRPSLNPVRRVVAGLAVATLGVTAVAGCSSGNETKADPTPTAGVSESGEPSDEPTSTQVTPSMGEDFRGILSDVTQDSCPLDKGKVEAKGNVLNSAKKAQDILITVVWLKKNSGDSVDINYFEAKNVAAGDTVKWSVEGELNQKAARCVLSAQANKVGTLK
jgi:hypothetical protein